MTRENKGGSGEDNETKSSSSQTSSKKDERAAEREAYVFRTLVHLLDGFLPLSPEEDKLFRADVEQDEEIQGMLKQNPQLTMFERWAVEDEREKHEKELVEERRHSKQAKQQAREAKKLANLAERRAKQAEQRAALLEARLRELGVDP